MDSKKDNIFDIYNNYLDVFNQDKLYDFICKYLIEDESFINIVNDIIAPKSLKDMTLEQRKFEFLYFFHNGHRSFILNVIVLKYLAQKFEKLSPNFLDGYWQEKFKKLHNYEI